MVLIPVETEKRDRVLLAYVLVQNDQNIRSVQHLAHNLASLLCVQFFQNIQNFCNDLANSKDRFHIILRFEVLHVVIEDFADDLVSYHLAHFVPAHFFCDIDELFGLLSGGRRS
jgi:hypothetical protein